MALENPVSSATSLAAVSGAVSPSNALPLGSDQSSYRARWTSATLSPCLRDGRQSRAPAARTTRDSLGTGVPLGQSFGLRINASGRPPPVGLEYPPLGVGCAEQIQVA